MASKSDSRRWILLGLVVLGVVVAATLPRSGTDEAEQETTPAESSAAQEGSAAPPAATQGLDGGKPSRRVAQGCQPVEESLKYEGFIDKRALVILGWNGMPERTAKLEIPVRVVGIEEGAIGVRFLDFPMREQYLNVWLGTEHIKPGPDGVYSVDPCSATVVEWTAMERGGAD